MADENFDDDCDCCNCGEDGFDREFMHEWHGTIVCDECYWSLKAKEAFPDLLARLQASNRVLLLLSQAGGLGKEDRTLVDETIAANDAVIRKAGG